MVQLGLVAISLMFGPQHVRDDNGFDFLAIVEVAVLFIGIFVAMQPALEILNARGATLGIDSSQEFYWATGVLSAVLDNAPTYLVFFKTAQTLAIPSDTMVAGVAEPLLTAISLGAVLMGAMTYIGNGPNFMVKTIAEKSGIRMPSFFGYVVYSVLILLPILALNAWLFLD
jgi:Na+/H+ antiporter NhaD/arsenite permease-like protein